MLLSNMTVAAQLYTAIPETALLRIHKDPSQHCLDTVHSTLQKYGIHLDIETAGTLHASIHRYEENNSTMVNSMKYIMMVIVNLCSKSMTVRNFIFYIILAFLPARSAGSFFIFKFSFLAPASRGDFFRP